MTVRESYSRALEEGSLVADSEDNSFSTSVQDLSRSVVVPFKGLLLEAASIKPPTPTYSNIPPPLAFTWRFTSRDLNLLSFLPPTDDHFHLTTAGLSRRVAKIEMCPSRSRPFKQEFDFQAIFLVAKEGSRYVFNEKNGEVIFVVP